MTAHVKTSRPLAVPIVAGEFLADSTGFIVRVTLQRWNGAAICDVRRFAPADEGAAQTGRGISVAVRKLPALAAAINAALDVARDLGLVNNE
jgi:hypothetical protein